MQLELNYLSEGHHEVTVNKLDSGVMGKEESLDFAISALSVASDILNNLELGLSSRIVDQASSIIKLEKT